MAFPPPSTPVQSPLNAALSSPINLVQATRDPGPNDVSYQPGQSEWLNTSNGNYWKYKGVKIVSGNAQAVWELLTTVVSTTDPTSADNFYTIGTFWSNTNTNALWALTSFSGTSAQWEDLTSNPSPSGVLQLTPQDLNVVLPDGSGNINISGDVLGFLTTVRTSANTLTIREAGVLATLYGGLGTNSLTNHGVLLGQGGSNTIHVTGAGVNGQLFIAATGADPAFGTLTSTGSTITYTAGANSLNLDIASPVSIAHGGSNATSFTQTHGIVAYDGTRLVNYAGPQISTTGIYTNTSQPAFLAYNSTDQTNVTGDNTIYTILFNSLQFDRGGNFSGNTFTAPVTGIYYIGATVVMTGISASHISGGVIINSTPISAVPATSNYANAVNGNGDLTVNVGIVLSLSASNTVTLQLQVAGGAKSVNVIGTINKTMFFGYLIE